MNSLNIFHTGGLTLGLSIVALGLLLAFWIPAFKARKSEYGRYNKDHKWVKLGDRTPLVKQNKFWFGVVVIILYIVAMLAVASDYKGV